MATCNVQELISADPCLVSLSDYEIELVRYQQLCLLYNNLASGDPLTCDIQELITDSRCLYGQPLHLIKVAQVQLLCEIFALL